MAHRSTQQWWRRALVAGATTAVLLPLTACGTTADTTSGAPATGSARPCKRLPDSTVPATQKALTQADTGTYCATPGTTILVALKASDLDAAHAWGEPSVTGPDGGVHQVTVPLTAVRGTTVAGFKVTAPGSYTFASETGAHQKWQALVEVSAR